MRNDVGEVLVLVAVVLLRLHSLEERRGGGETLAALGKLVLTRHILKQGYKLILRLRLLFYAACLLLLLL
ncbi:hypothetical protein DQ04_13291010 [Trypanosoma grayi]|uniref:hypothetical protein n=1 Tax=Trypanosoma grayi TaxID=71804 RepID=UPI0004F4A4A1|nr:hypothetical protein DQ04_13291010 [Trypanosoma grayi]KEG06573.1 hypothetical protein DQ04_13291010 [Trypanosoma grayi]